MHLEDTMKRLVRLLDIALLVALALGILIVPAAQRASAQTPPPPIPDVNQAITDAVNAEVSSSQPKLLGFENNNLVVSNILYSNDRRTALVWLAQRDPETGYPDRARARAGRGAQHRRPAGQVDRLVDHHRDRRRVCQRAGHPAPRAGHR